MVSGTASFLRQAWNKRGLLPCLLRPIAGIYGALIDVRWLLYRLGVLNVQRVDAVVVVVGNVVVGGAGKTPTVIAIAKHLQRRGTSCGIVSRGYGRLGHQVQAVYPESRPADVGDEPLLLHEATGCPVYVGSSRYAAARALLIAHPSVQVILCDDGLQHYGLYRDIEICVFDDRGAANGWLLPAGPLRELWPRRFLRQCGQLPQNNLNLHTGNQAAFSGFHAKRSLAPWARNRLGQQLALQDLAQWQDKPLFAIAGLAQPEAFFGMLDALGLPLAGRLGLPDHFDFQNFDIGLAQQYTILCTEKDATKLWPLVPEAWAVPLVQTMGNDFWQALDRLLDGVQD